MDNNMDKYLGQLLDNRYEILEVIGTGGMAVVYKALCHRLNRHVAVKMLKDDLALDADFRRRFQTESQAVAMLSHPNIVSVYDVSRTSNPEYIVMELIEGITLKQYMTRRGALSWKEALHFATQITKALEHAHNKGIVHRDIKPHNIMVLRDGNIKVADFGIARLQTSENTLTTEALGSVHYISPEQAKGGNVDARTDIYAVGVVMYEMLTGKLPFEGDSAVSVAIQHISATPIAPGELNPEIPTGLEAITMKAMNPDINARYQSAEALLDDLEGFHKSQSLAVATPQETGIAQQDHDGTYLIYENVEPVSRSGELSRESYARRRTRSQTVSLLSGFFCVAVFILALFVFLWNFWIKELFSDPERMYVPDFVGSYAEDVMSNENNLDVFEFHPVEIIDSTYEKGVVVSQDPAPKESIMRSSEKTPMTLFISSGDVEIVIPDVYNTEYRQAEIDLKKIGLYVIVDVEASDTITKDYVIGTVPQAGEKMSGGDTIHLIVSGGPDIEPIIMPDLKGMTEKEATEEIERLRLSLGNVTPIESSEAVGTVVWQSQPVGSEVMEHTKIYLQISGGRSAPPSSPADDTGEEGGEGEGNADPPPGGEGGGDA